MPENNETPAEVTEAPEAEETATEEAPETDEESTDEEFDSKKALAKIRKQNQENQSLRKRLKEIEDANKSEDEKRTERLSTLEKAATEYELKAARLEVAIDKGLTAAQAKRLVGSTKEELEADADELLETFGSKRLSRKPNEQLRGGSEPAKPVEDLDPRKLAGKIRRPYS